MLLEFHKNLRVIKILITARLGLSYDTIGYPVEELQNS